MTRARPMASDVRAGKGNCLHPRDGRGTRVLLVTTWFPTTLAPTSGIFVLRDAEALSRVCEVEVLHLVAPSVDDGIRRTRLRGVSVHRQPMDPKSPRSVLAAARALSVLLRDSRRRPDILHSVAASSLLPLALVPVNQPWVHTEHWSGFSGARTLGRRALLAILGCVLRRPDEVCAVSIDLASRIEALAHRRVRVVPNVVEVAPTLVERRPVTKDALRVIGVGWVIDGKGPLLAVDAVAELRNRGWNAELVWVGTGELEGRMRERARARSVPLVLTGSLPSERVAEELAHSDVFVLPTRAETFCLAAAEALGAGRPVVVGAKGGQRAFVAPPSGHLVDSRDADAYADAVESVIEESAQLSAEEIAAPIRERYSAVALAQAYDAVYGELLGSRRQSRPRRKEA